MYYITDLASFDEGLWDFSITPTVACRDQIGYSTTFEEGRQFPARKEHIDKLDHLHKTQSDHRGLRIVTQTQSVNETSAAGNYILQNINMNISKYYLNLIKIKKENNNQ